MWLSIILAIVGALAGGATQLTTIFGEHVSEIILAVMVISMTVGNAVNAVLHAIPSRTPDNTYAASKFPLGPTV
jgi:hypothetical protein